MKSLSEYFEYFENYLKRDLDYTGVTTDDLSRSNIKFAFDAIDEGRHLPKKAQEELLSSAEALASSYEGFVPSTIEKRFISHGRILAGAHSLQKEFEFEVEPPLEGQHSDLGKVIFTFLMNLGPLTPAYEEENLEAALQFDRDLLAWGKQTLGR